MKTLSLILSLVICTFAFNMDVSLTFENVTSKTVSFKLLRGHIFDSVEWGNNTQNMIVAQDYWITIGPNERKTFSIIMTCIDSDRSPPPEGTQVRPTPLAMRQRSIDSPGGPSNSIDQVIQNARERARIIN